MEKRIAMRYHNNCMLTRLCLALGVFAILSPLLWFVSAQEKTATVAEAVVTQVTVGAKGGRTVSVHVQSPAQFAGRKYDIVEQAGLSPNSLPVKTGDRVIVSLSKDPTGRETVYITDYVRTMPLFVLMGLFVAITLVIAHWHGLRSLVGMLLSFAVIMGFILPQMIAGSDPVVVTLMGAFLIIPLTFYLSHGSSMKTTVSVTGTLLALVVTGISAFVFVKGARLTGFTAEEAYYLQYLKSGALNIQSLLLAGIIIGALGVLDDITISQTAIVQKLYAANPKYSLPKLYSEAMSIGRDHIASLVNTLILVYTGASLPLLLLFYNTNISYQLVANQEIIATEIVRTMVSSIGIILAVPLTTLLAVIFVQKRLLKA